MTSAQVTAAAQVAGVDVDGLVLPGLSEVRSCADGSVPALKLIALLESTVAAELDTDAEVLDLSVAWDRVTAWAQARQLSAVAEFVRRPIVTAQTDPVVAKAMRRPPGQIARDFGGGDELGAALGLTPRGGQDRVGVAVALAGRLPGTLAALESGRVDYPRVLAMVDEAGGCSRERAAEVEQSVLAKGRRGSPGDFRRAVRRAVIRIDAETAAARAQAARRDVWIRTRAADTDTAWLDAHLGAADAAAIRAALDAAASAMVREPAEKRTLDQLRVAALAAPFWAALATGVLQTPDGPLSLASAHGWAAAVQVRQGPDAGTADGAVAELDGFGPITPGLGRELASLSRPGRRPVVRVLPAVDRARADAVAAAWPLEPGYRPSAALVRHVIERDRTCWFPGCNIQASRCDIDHTRAWPEGATHPSDLGAGCRHHHRFKQHVAVHVEQPQPGRFRWTLPTGHTYEVGLGADDP